MLRLSMILTMTRRQKNIVVIGAGIGGLSAALLLAQAGHAVTILEAQAQVGGKARRFESKAGPVDAGPTVLTMRGVFDEMFETAGTRLAEHVSTVPLDVLARHVWPDGSQLDLHADAGRSEAAVAAFAGSRSAAEFRAFTARARHLFEAFEAPVMRHPRPTPLGVAAAVGRDAARLVPAMAPLSSLATALSRQFSDPRLAQLFGRYATYVGGSPYLSPAILMLIWHAEAAGVWVAEAGISGLARTIAALALARGATVRTEAPVREIEIRARRVEGVILTSGERLAAEAVVFNGDPAALGAGLLGSAAAVAAPAMPRRRRSLSACVWAFAAAPRGLDLAYHTVIFGGPPRLEFDDLFRHRRTPRDPTVYVCAQDRLGDRARPGLERLMMIVNAPADGDGLSSTEDIQGCTDRTFARLRASGLQIEAPEAPPTTPADFAALFPATGGALYGAAPHGMRASFRRPTARTRVAGLYLAGGGTHPGPGVAMSCLSGRLAAAAICEDHAST